MASNDLFLVTTVPLTSYEMSHPTRLWSSGHNLLVKMTQIKQNTSTNLVLLSKPHQIRIYCTTELILRWFASHYWQPCSPQPGIPPFGRRWHTLLAEQGPQALLLDVFVWCSLKVGYPVLLPLCHHWMKAPEQLMPHALHCLKINIYTESRHERLCLSEITDNWDMMPCNCVDRHQILGHAMAQVVSCWPLTANAQVQSQASPCGIWYSNVSIVSLVLLSPLFTYHWHYLISATDSIIN